MGNVTKAYEDDPEAFEKEIRAVYKDVFTLFDTNMDCLLEKDEFVRALHDNSHYDNISDIAYFNSFREPDGVPISQVLDAWIEFHTGKTVKNLTLLSNLYK